MLSNKRKTNYIISFVKNKYRRFGNLSLQKMLILPFVLLISLTGIVIGILSFNNGENAVNNLADNLIEEISIRITEQVNIILTPLHLANNLSSDAVYLEHINLNNNDQLEKYFWYQIQNFPSLSFVYWGNPAGEFYGVRREINDNINIVVSNINTNYTNHIFKTNDIGERGELLLNSGKYDSRTRPWYQVAIKNKKASWTNIYFDFSLKVPGITAVLPIYKNGNLEGVFGSDLLFDRLNKFLSTLKIGKTGKAFIVDTSGVLVANSFGGNNFTEKQGVFSMIKAEDSDDFITKKIAKFLIKENNDFSQITKEKKFRLSIDNANYSIKLTPFSDQYGLNWFVIVVVPEADLMENIQLNTRITVVLCIVALILAVFISILISKSVAVPILKLNEAAKQIAFGNWGQKITINRNDEIGQLAKSFNIMFNQLQEFFSNLETKNQELEIIKKQVQEANQQLKQTNIELRKQLAFTERLLFENALSKNINRSIDTYQYQIGGTLKPDAPSYVVRESDMLLYQSLIRGQFCYIFNPRQMGKSSMQVKIAAQLKNDGYHCVFLDLSEFVGERTTIDIFYSSLTYHISKKSNLLDFNIKTWNNNLDFLSSLERFSEFLKEIILKKFNQDIIIFIDEIDVILKVKFASDSFFPLIRSFYNQRVNIPEYKRLTFCLSGRTTPSDLIENRENTPFNIGVPILLNGFTKEEIKRSDLLQGIKNKYQNINKIIEEVLKWTGGQPFLTQKVLNYIKNNIEYIPDSKESEIIENLVNEKIIYSWKEKDEPKHFRTIQDKFLRNNNNPKLLLKTYLIILENGFIEDRDTWENQILLMAGIVRRSESKLQVYNQIYKKIFDREWVEFNLNRL